MPGRASIQKGDNRKTRDKSIIMITLHKCCVQQTSEMKKRQIHTGRHLFISGFTLLNSSVGGLLLLLFSVWKLNSCIGSNNIILSPIIQSARNLIDTTGSGKYKNIQRLPWVMWLDACYFGKHQYLLYLKISALV